MPLAKPRGWNYPKEAETLSRRGWSRGDTAWGAEAVGEIVWSLHPSLTSVPGPQRVLKCRGGCPGRKQLGRRAQGAEAGITKVESLRRPALENPNAEPWGGPLLSRFRCLGAQSKARGLLLESQAAVGFDKTGSSSTGEKCQLDSTATSRRSCPQSGETLWGCSQEEETEQRPSLPFLLQPAASHSCPSMYHCRLSSGSLREWIPRKTTNRVSCSIRGTSLVAHLVKNPPAMQKTLAWFLGGEDPLEKG